MLLTAENADADQWRRHLLAVGLSACWALRLPRAFDAKREVRACSFANEGVNFYSTAQRRPPGRPGTAAKLFRRPITSRQHRASKLGCESVAALSRPVAAPSSLLGGLLYTLTLAPTTLNVWWFRCTPPTRRTTQLTICARCHHPDNPPTKPHLHDTMFLYSPCTA